MRNSVIIRFVVLLEFMLLSSCASLHPPSEAANARPLLAPATLKGDREATQIVHGAFGARELTMHCVLTVHGDILTVVGLTALGVRAFTLHYDGKEIQVDHDLPVPPQLTPERLLADIQLVYWPLSALQPVLQKAGWQLTEPFSGTRRLRRGATLIAEIHYAAADPWNARSWLVNLQHSYTLGIESTSLTAP